MLTVNRLLFFFILVFIVVFHTTDILFSTYYSFLDYDLGKVISYSNLYPEFLSYMDHLKFPPCISRDRRSSLLVKPDNRPHAAYLETRFLFILCPFLHSHDLSNSS